MGLVLFLERGKHVFVNGELVGIFKKQGEKGWGRTVRFKIFRTDESTIVLGARVTLQWEAAENWGKDEPPHRGERVGEGNSLIEEREMSHQ